MRLKMVVKRVPLGHSLRRVDCVGLVLVASTVTSRVLSPVRLVRVVTKRKMALVVHSVEPMNTLPEEVVVWPVLRIPMLFQDHVNVLHVLQEPNPTQMDPLVVLCVLQDSIQTTLLLVKPVLLVVSPPLRGQPLVRHVLVDTKRLRMVKAVLFVMQASSLPKDDVHPVLPMNGLRQGLVPVRCVAQDIKW